MHLLHKLFSERNDLTFFCFCTDSKCTFLQQPVSTAPNPVLTASPLATMAPLSAAPVTSPVSCLGFSHLGCMNLQLTLLLLASLLFLQPVSSAPLQTSAPIT